MERELSLATNQPFMAAILELIAPGSRLTKDGEGATFDLAESATRTFLCVMEITAQVEQESVEISVWGSEDGASWGKTPLLIMPQQFYRGRTSQILDVSLRPEIRFIRARWKLTRWGRVSPHPMFQLGFTATEIPAFARQSA
jgi:hypothetical protein